MASLPPLATYPTSAEIYAALQQFVANNNGLITNWNPGGVGDTMLKAISVALGSDADTLPNVNLAGAYQLLTAARNAEYISTATGTDLDRKCEDVGIFRKQPTAAIGICQINVAAGGTVPAGTIVVAYPSDPTQAPVQFTTNASTVCAADTPTNAAITCSQTGSIGNVIEGAISQIQYAGATVTNAVATSYGDDTEQDDSPNGGLRARGLAAIPNDTECTVPAIKQAALTYAGIVSAYVLDLTYTDGVTPAVGYAQLYVADVTGDIGNPSNPSYPILEKMQADFTSGLYKAAGAFVTVHGSRVENVTLALSIYVLQSYLNAGGTEAQVISAIQLALQTAVNATPISGTVRLSLMVATAQGLGNSTTAPDARTGVAYIVDSSVTINGSDADYTPPQGYQPHITTASSAITVTVLGTV